MNGTQKENFKVFACLSLCIGLMFTLKPQDFNYEGDLKEEPFLFVSLGYNCWIAEALRRYGLRQAAFPFDWMFSIDHDGLIRCLDEDFKYFTDEKFISVDEQEAPAVKNSRYGVIFMHDWPFPDNKIT